MKKNLTKKLMLSVLTLAFAVVSLGASTFAWFTVSKDAQVATIEANVIGGSGIEIAIGTAGLKEGDANYYKSPFYVNQLPGSEVETVKTKMGFDKLTNVTCLKQDTLANTSFAGNLYKLDGGAAAASGYLKFTIYVRVEAAGDLALNKVNFTAADSKGWKSGLDYTAGSGQAVGREDAAVYNVLDAIRLSVTSGDVNKVYERAAVAEADRAATKPGNSVGFSKKGAYYIYNEKNAVETITEEGTKTTYPLSLDVETAKLATTTFTENDKYLDMDVAANADYVNAIQLDVAEDTEYAFEVCLWLEGYDAECLNAIFAAGIELDLAFAWKQKTESWNATFKNPTTGA